ncbi:MAG: FAD:protein FMN transferase [Clostridiales bacterium]|nr:FAD:protein FMN transferase [Clostridiales bacterium]
MNKIAGTLILLLLISLLPACGSPKFYQSQFFAMDTLVEISLYAESPSRAQAAFAAAEAEFRRINDLCDRFAEKNLPDPAKSDVWRINQAGGQAVPVSPDTLAMVEGALEIGLESGGAFDITVGKLMDLWDFGGSPHKPGEAELAKALESVDYSLVRLDKQAGVVTVPDGMVLDLGGVAKGYATEQAGAMLREQGITRAIINAGGNVLALGHKPDGSLWQVGIRHPRDQGEIAGILQLDNQAAVTSADSERFFILEGIRYHHILNPNSGQPARELASVTIVADTSFEAELLSTAVFVLGRKGSSSLLSAHPGVGVVYIDLDMQVEATDNIRDSFF